jgi:hypothetical protein
VHDDGAAGRREAHGQMQGQMSAPAQRRRRAGRELERNAQRCGGAHPDSDKRDRRRRTAVMDAAGHGRPGDARRLGGAPGGGNGQKPGAGRGDADHLADAGRQDEPDRRGDHVGDVTGQAPLGVGPPNGDGCPIHAVPEGNAAAVEGGRPESAGRPRAGTQLRGAGEHGQFVVEAGVARGVVDQPHEAGTSRPGRLRHHEPERVDVCVGEPRAPNGRAPGAARAERHRGDTTVGRRAETGVVPRNRRGAISVAARGPERERARRRTRVAHSGRRDRPHAERVRTVGQRVRAERRDACGERSPVKRAFERRRGDARGERERRLGRGEAGRPGGDRGQRRVVHPADPRRRRGRRARSCS